MGAPGWPELACCTASIESVRMVLMQSWSIVCWGTAVCWLTKTPSQGKPRCRRKRNDCRGHRSAGSGGIVQQKPAIWRASKTDYLGGWYRPGTLAYSEDCDDGARERLPFGENSLRARKLCAGRRDRFRREHLWRFSREAGPQRV